MSSLRQIGQIGFSSSCSSSAHSKQKEKCIQGKDMCVLSAFLQTTHGGRLKNILDAVGEVVGQRLKEKWCA